MASTRRHRRRLRDNLCTGLWLITALVLTALLSCARVDDGADPLAQDRDRFDRIQALDADEVDQVQALAREIEDSVVRSAAVDGWIRENRQSLTREDGLTLCDLLEAAASGQCRRSFSAVHLQR
jgi:hypothetical protein